MTSTVGFVDAVSRSIARNPMNTLARREERRLGERGEVLGLAVPVLVRDVRRPAGDAESEEGEERRDEVRARVNRLGDEAEAVRGEPDGELQHDERGGRHDGQQCRCGAAGSFQLLQRPGENVLRVGAERVRLAVEEKRRDRRGLHGAAGAPQRPGTVAQLGAVEPAAVGGVQGVGAR